MQSCDYEGMVCSKERQEVSEDPKRKNESSDANTMSVNEGT